MREKSRSLDMQWIKRVFCAALCNLQRAANTIGQIRSALARKTGQILQSQDSYADKLLPECVHLCNQFIVLFFFFLIFLPPPVSLGMTKIIGTVQAEQSGDKVGEVGLRWFGHDERWRIYWTKDVDDGAC